MWGTRNEYLLENLARRGHMGDLGIDVKIIFKWILEKLIAQSI